MEYRGRILFVDDEPDYTDIVKWQLEKRSYLVNTANSGHDALAILVRKETDVLLSDIRMPGMDGIELITQAQSIDIDVRCIVITGHGDVDTAIEAMKAGAVNYLKKPASVDELDMAIARALESLSMIRKSRQQQVELEQNNRELKELRARLEELLASEKSQREAAETALKTRLIRESIVELLSLSLRLWKQSTGKTKIDFAEETRIWSASIDANGTYRTRTLDKYLKLSTLPPNPRHSDVMDSAYHVLTRCTLSPEMKLILEKKTKQLEILIFSSTETV